MALYVDVRVNNRTVASAGVVNKTVEPGAHVCDYDGHAYTAAFWDRGAMRHTLEIPAHDRRVSVWRLVAKIATQLAEKEEMS